jgi:hypothetical protein
MRHALWLLAGVLCLTGCPDDDGGVGGGGGEQDGTTGTNDATPEDMRPMADAGPDAEVPPTDMAVVPDMAVVTPDMTVLPDQGADMGPLPDMELPPECQVGDTRDCGDCAGGTQACVDGTFGPCVFPAEACNGLDDDCDQQTDEGFAGLGEACNAGVGVCATAGEVVCNGLGDGVVCNAVPGAAQAELCDALDNDCDGTTDEELSQACYGGPDGTENVGVCLGGVQVCADGEFGPCQGAVLPGDEACNGGDDDCDGTTDESMGGAALVEGCYDGPEGTAGQGICRGGQRICQAGAFGPCDGQILPGIEICDLSDNDCNGGVDDRPGGCECIPGEVQGCYSGPAGTAGVGVCVEGRQICNDNGNFGPCEGEVVPQVEICDGADNDCDGDLDDAIEGTGRPCSAGVGACLADGETVCDARQGAVVCNAVAGQPRPEVCNQIDDNCNGTNDEGLGLGDACSVGIGACTANGQVVCNGEGGTTCSARAGQPRAELCNQVDDNCNGQIDDGLGLGEACTVGVGACARQGQRVCDANGQITCSVQPGQPGAEACDSIDNDCDSSVDEGNPGGGQDCNTGVPGVCAAGVRICEGGRFACQQQVQPGAETCDGLDNNCNGNVDESAAGGPLSRACYDGPGGTQGVGLCRGGTQTCAGGQFRACEGQVLPQAEVCDSADNDCNNRVDDLPAGMCVCAPGSTRACYSGPGGTQNVGICRGGMQTCQANGQGYGACQGEVLPGAEICDGRDNDCNNRVDDAAGVGVACTNGVGECRRDGALACNAQNGQLECNARPGNPVAELCDSRDNNCNGQIDDVAGLGDRCTNGQGVCQAAGNQVCDLNRQALVCNAVPGMGGAETCDGEDDDCDGRTDEQVAGVGAACTAGVGECLERGVTVCQGANGIQCGAMASAPEPELCDGLDNNCNGNVDDAPVDVGRACMVGVGACQAPGQTVCVRNSLSCQGNPLPPQFELCNGIDDNCNGQTDENLNCNVFRSCAHAKQQGQNASAIYLIAADGVAANARSVWCDMTTDGGGWTLVGSTLNTTLNDQASDWYLDLVRLDPAAGNVGIWNGLRPLGERFDVRFSCRAAVGGANAPMDVDLSFYDTPWYREFTNGTDADSCFSEANGDAADSKVPARRNNLTSEFRRREDPYGATYLEGEDTCAAVDDFTVDFDDRGMDSDQSDTTDWGEDDSTRKCGASGVAGGQWFVWVRERPRVAVVGLQASVSTLLRNNGILADALAYDANLPPRLTTENYDTLVIGRYATNWPRMTQDLKEALDIFARNGGNIVTEWDGAAIFGQAYDASYLNRAGAPTPLGQHTVRIGGGQLRGNNTPVNLVVPADPVFQGVANPFRAGGATEYFTWLDDAIPAAPGQEFPVLSNLRVLGSFAGGVAAFPNANYGAVYRGRYCGGNALFATFDWEDDPNNAGFGPFLVNLVREANLPAPADLPDACQDSRRNVVMLCGTSQRPLTEFGVTSRILATPAGQCNPGNDVQAMFVTRNGTANLNAAAWRAYVQNGGIIISEFSSSDEVFNAVFAPNPVVAQGARIGGCADNVMPQVLRNGDNSLWQENRFSATAVANAGCGHDLAAYPSITPLGGWDAATVQLAYRDLGKGRVWLVESDWQDTQASMTDASRGLLRYMHLHRAQGAFDRGATFAGVRVNQDIHTYLKRGFQPCLQTPYNSTLPLEGIRDNCVGDVLMMACRRVDNGQLTVAAIGSRAEVLEDVGVGVNSVNAHNGVNWYYSPNRSWGYAPAGAGVNRNSCDTNGGAEGTRMCWHTNNDQITPGYRCGSNLNLNGDATWERVILHRFGDVPVDVVIP